MSSPYSTSRNDDSTVGETADTRSMTADATTSVHDPGSSAAEPMAATPADARGYRPDPDVTGYREGTNTLNHAGGFSPADTASTDALEPTPAMVVPAVEGPGTVLARQQQRFGGMKIGSAFFGWLTATGMAVLLISVLAAAGVAFGVTTSQTVERAVQESQDGTATAQTVGLVGAITLLVILFLAYYCGGYVAGRMARFHGARQGLAVWLWGIVMALIIAGIGWLAGSQYDVLARLDLPRIPVNEGDVTAVGLIAIGSALLTGLLGAVIGGLVGMRFHRRVDAAALEAPADTAATIG